MMYLKRPKYDISSFTMPLPTWAVSTIGKTSYVCHKSIQPTMYWQLQREWDGLQEGEFRKPMISVDGPKTMARLLQG